MGNLNQKRCDNSSTSTSGRVSAGIILLVVGTVLFARQLGVELPYWLFRWEMFLIVLGIFIGAKHSFRRSGWIFPVLIGSFFLLDDLFLNVRLKDFFWPSLILIAGAIMIVAPFKRKNWEKRFSDIENQESPDDFIDTTSVFGGVKKNIITKNFKGGQIFNVFGGVELDLTQSDIDGVIVLEITQVFGGTKLILPAHWEVKTEVTAIIGGVDDKRKNFSALNIAEGKTLILRGTSIFAGIDIKSF